MRVKNVSCHARGDRYATCVRDERAVDETVSLELSQVFVLRLLTHGIAFDHLPMVPYPLSHVDKRRVTHLPLTTKPSQHLTSACLHLQTRWHPTSANRPLTSQHTIIYERCVHPLFGALDGVPKLRAGVLLPMPLS